MHIIVIYIIYIIITFCFQMLFIVEITGWALFLSWMPDAQSLHVWRIKLPIVAEYRLMKTKHYLHRHSIQTNCSAMTRLVSENEKCNFSCGALKWNRPGFLVGEGDSDCEYISSSTSINKPTDVLVFFSFFELVHISACKPSDTCTNLPPCLFVSYPQLVCRSHISRCSRKPTQT